MASAVQETEQIASSLLVLILLVVLAILVIDLLVVLPSAGGILGGGLLRAIIVNTIVGFVIIFLLNALFHLGIRYTIWVFIFVAIFGLLAVAIIVILRLLGVRW